jgi:AGCS family alanine or glycine:cation symporter
VGYDSVVQSETRISIPRKQATISIYALLSDTIICIITNTMIGVTGSWYTLNDLAAGDLVAKILGNYFPYSNLFVTLLMFFAGFTTIIAFLAAGMKCAKYLHPRYGRNIYLAYSVVAFIIFSNLTQDKMILFMEFISGLLVLVNILGIIRLRKEIDFS